jgi:hypothetical protein
MGFRLTVYFVVLGVLPGLGYQYVQDELRPRGGWEGVEALFLGVAPNFLGGVSLTATLIAIAVAALTDRSPRFLMLAAALVSFVGLIAWETAQTAMPGGTFDEMDLLATGPGVLISLVAALLFLPHTRK